MQSQGYKIPDYPEDPKTEAEKEIKARYGKVLGSAVNPVLREGNSDRRAAASVKQFARKHPHRMGKWAADSKTRVAHMSGGDFYGSEKSVTVPEAVTTRIEFVGKDGKVTVLKDKLSLKAGEIIDAAVMNRRALRQFYAEQIAAAKKEDVLLSLHLKATMMKISDPIMFGHAVSVFFQNVFDKHGALLKELKVNVNNGFGDMEAKVLALPEDKRAAIVADIADCFRNQPPLAMVNSDKGITNLHVPSDVIIDASMPPMIRDGGKMWGADGKPYDTLAMIPDRCYAGVYVATVEDCKKNGALDPATMGTVPNVGLMAQQAEEYGSHDKTFEIAGDGVVRIVDSCGQSIAGAESRARRHLPRLPDQGCAHPGLGEARRHARTPVQHAGHFLAGQEPCARCADHRQGREVPQGSRHRAGWTSGSWNRRTPAARHWRASARARTPSPSPATCCATTSPTCSPSWNSTPAPRCCPSCR